MGGSGSVSGRVVRPACPYQIRAKRQGGLTTGRRRTNKTRGSDESVASPSCRRQDGGSPYGRDTGGHPEFYILNSAFFI